MGFITIDTKKYVRIGLIQIWRRTKEVVSNAPKRSLLEKTVKNSIPGNSRMNQTKNIGPSALGNTLRKGVASVIKRI